MQPANPPILYQQFFKSVGPRTYAIQIKQASNGNHYLCIIERQRDKQTGELYKRRLHVFSEDFEEFWKLVGRMQAWIRRNPVPEKVAARQHALWRKRSAIQQASATPSAAGPSPPDRAVQSSRAPSSVVVSAA